MNNPYLPQKVELLEVIQETSTDIDIKTYKLKFSDGEKMDFMPGQFVELSIPGVGEAPLVLHPHPLTRNLLN